MADITGTEGSDSRIGSDGADTMLGLGGNDQLDGRGGDDSINGGDGNDILTGGSGVDTLTGGSGADLFLDTMAGLNGDHITDLSIGDRIIITDLASPSFGLTANSITYQDGNSIDSIRVDNLGPGRFIVRALDNGFQLSLQGNAHADFNGDGRSDVLWRNDDGTVSEWLATENGGFVAGAGASIGPDWHVQGMGDFNGDGRDDVLWRNDNGTVTEWLSQTDGSWVDNSANVHGFVDPSWHVTGLADMNGDGRTDILWRNTDGTVSEWLANANGSFTSGAGASVGPDWTITGTGDFNGDGINDVLWRNDNGTLTEWLGQPNGGWVDNGANLKGFVDPSWSIVAAADMNGDGLSDILWRKADGTVSEWLANADKSGSFTSGAGASVTADWHIASTGDFNGDGIDDVLWRNDDGHVTEWLGQTNGGWVDNAAHASGALSNSWHIQDHLF